MAPSNDAWLASKTYAQESAAAAPPASQTSPQYPSVRPATVTPAAENRPESANWPRSIANPAITTESATPGSTASAAAAPVQASGSSLPATPDSTAPAPVAAEPETPEPEPPPAVMTERTIIDLGDQPDQVTFTFQEAPWPEVLQEFAQWAGLTLDLTDTPPGYFSYFDSRSHSPAEAIDILNGYLLPRGYVLLRRDRFLVTLKTDNAMLPNLIPTIELSELDSRGDNELIRVVVSTEEISPEVAAQEVQGLLGPFGAATPLESSQSLVLQGFGGTLRQALDVLGKSKPAITDDKLDFRAFSLQHLPASDAEKQIRVLFGISGGNVSVNVSDAKSEIDRANYYRNREQNGRDDRSRESAPPPIPLLKKVAMNMQVSSLERTNSVLVTATPAGLQLVENILTSIDVPQNESSQQFVSDSGPVLRVYNMSSADEGEVAKTLDVLMPGIVVNEDRRQDTIHIFATPREHEEVIRLIRTLNQSETSGRLVEVIPLRVVNPTNAAMVLSRMFDNDDRDERPMIQAELPSRSLVVRGNTEQISQVRDALVGLGEPDSQRTGAKPDRVRRIAVGARSAEAIANAAEKILSSDKQFRNPVRVVVPGQTDTQTSNQIDEINEQATRRLDRGVNRPLSAAAVDSASVKPVGLTMLASSTQGKDGQEKKSSPSTSAGRSSVSIEVQGDQLLVYSGDPEALDDVEGMIRELMRQMPEQTHWTVFYLRVAEAEQAAAKLIDLTQDLQSDPLLGPYDERQPLRIIPDKRTNAIFVSGPQDQVAEVENFLEYIDASDVPGSFLRREPHAIAVKYADVNEIAELLRTLYKDFLVDPVAERMRLERSSRSSRSSDRDEDSSRSSSDRSSSSSSSGSSKTESPGIRLTLAVDSKTGELLVACNDQLFQEIEAVVRQRDEAVRDSQPTVEFVPITGSTPPNLIELLNGLSPRIRAEAVLPAEESSRSSGYRSSSQRGSSSYSRDQRR
ncbi:MAG: secretin N-terminal domain-containing protein [Planctomycetaceae bacterium]